MIFDIHTKGAIKPEVTTSWHADRGGDLRDFGTITLRLMGTDTRDREFTFDLQLYVDDLYEVLGPLQKAIDVAIMEAGK